MEAFKVKDCQNLDRAIINRLPAYCPFEESYIYQNKAGESFGWGLWNDPNGRKKGKTSDLIQMKKGYERFLEMSKNVSYPFGKTKDSQGNTISRKRYGYTSDKAKQLAEKRLGDL